MIQPSRVYEALEELKVWSHDPPSRDDPYYYLYDHKIRALKAEIAALGYKEMLGR